MTESTDKVAVGLLTGMEPRQNGWFRFTVQEPGRQYPIRVDTKKADVVEQAKALMGQSVKITYGEQQSENINPNNNQPYTNRYLNQIAMAGAGDVSTQEAAPPPAGGNGGNGGGGGGGAQQMRPDQKKELRIMRECAAKLAVDMAAHGILPADQQNVHGLIAASETWVAYFAYGPSRFGVQAFNQIGAQGAPPAGEPVQQQLPTEQAPPPEPPPPAFTCEICGTHDDGNHKDGCPNDIPF